MNKRYNENVIAFDSSHSTLPNDLTAITKTTVTLAPYGITSNCRPGDLLGPVGILVQLALALLAFSALIVKRYCEPKVRRRSWRIWFYDTSKQAIGAAVVHFANVFLAGVSKGDPCTWYLISFLLDSTVGLLIIYAGLKSFQFVAVKKNWKLLMFGEYGVPPSGWAWLGQCLVYIVVMVIEKTLIALLVLPQFWVKVRNFLMSWINNPHLELVIVMFIVPLVVNALVFWVVDNFLKKNIQQKLSVPSGDGQSTKSLLKPRHYYGKIRHDESDMSGDDDIELHTRGVINGRTIVDKLMSTDSQTVL